MTNTRFSEFCSRKLSAAATIGPHIITHGQNYGYLPRLGELRADEEEMQRYFEENGGDQELAHEEFMRQLERRIIEAADKSAMSNDRRATYLHRARQSLFTVSMLTFLTGLVFVLATLE
jgi:hypothetical protein